jgi:hypothetical protein
VFSANKTGPHGLVFTSFSLPNIHSNKEFFVYTKLWRQSIAPSTHSNNFYSAYIMSAAENSSAAFLAFPAELVL